MCEELPKSEIEVRICEACGRDFTIEMDEIMNPMQEIFCPDCLSPYLLEGNE